MATNLDTLVVLPPKGFLLVSQHSLTRCYLRTYRLLPQPVDNSLISCAWPNTGIQFSDILNRFT